MCDLQKRFYITIYLFGYVSRNYLSEDSCSARSRTLSPREHLRLERWFKPIQGREKGSESGEESDEKMSKSGTSVDNSVASFGLSPLYDHGKQPLAGHDTVAGGLFDGAAAVVALLANLGDFENHLIAYP